jgi:hypothetical protein
MPTPVPSFEENIDVNVLPLDRIDSETGEIDSNCNGNCNDYNICNTSVDYNGNGHNSNDRTYHNEIDNDNTDKNTSNDNNCNIDYNNENINNNNGIIGNCDGNINDNDSDTNIHKSNANDNEFPLNITIDKLTINGNHADNVTDDATNGDCNTYNDGDHILDHNDKASNCKVACNKDNDHTRNDGCEVLNSDNSDEFNNEDLTKYDISAIPNDNNGSDNNSGRISGYLHGCSGQEDSSSVINGGILPENDATEVVLSSGKTHPYPYYLPPILNPINQHTMLLR